MRPKLLLPAGALLGLLGVVLLLGGADTTRAGSFNPTLEVTVEDNTPETSSNFTSDFGVPSGDVNFAGVIAFIPRDWGVVPGDQVPIGAHVGSLTSQATLGLINGACNSRLTVEFTFLNSNTNPADTVDYDDGDDNGTPDFAEDKDENNIPDAIDKYPDFITRVLVDENGDPLTPLRRSAGITIVAGLPILLQFLIFEPGTVINAALPSDEALGYPSVTLLINAGDPAAVPVPGAITDFCTPLTSANTTFGVSQDNPDTDTDEPDVTLFVNPKDGKHIFTTLALGLRDADGDGLENSLDTCALAPNEGDPRVGGDGDFDEDGLDAACDPDDNTTNSDEDADGYLNRQDNCPLDANGENEDNQADADSDQIGDACDPNPDDADAQGKLASAQLASEVTIGTGEGTGGPPECPECFGGGGGGGGGGLSTGALIGIIVGIVAAVVVVGGAAVYMRRRSAAA